jgi:Initiator Replication protein
MASNSVKWQSPTEGEGSRGEVSGLLAWASLESIGGQTIVSWEFSFALREEILNPNVFAQLRMEVLSQLRTHPGVFLCEMACRYINVGQSSKRPWRWWHDPLTGRPPDEARLNALSYAVFKRDVLKPALAELNAISPFNVVLLEYRKGKFPTSSLV